MRTPWYIEPARRVYWRNRRWVIALRAVLWLVTLPLVLLALGGEKLMEWLQAFERILPAMEVRTCCGSPHEHKPECPSASPACVDAGTPR